MLIARRNLMCGGKTLPYDYELKWIKIVGGIYVDTELVPADVNQLDATIYLPYLYPTTPPKQIIGCNHTAGFSVFGYSQGRTAIYSSVQYTNKLALVDTNSVIGLPINIRQTIRSSGNHEFSVNGDTQSFQADITMGWIGKWYLFHTNRYNYPANEVQCGRISVTTDGGVFRAIPCVKDGMVGWYEEVSGKFYSKHDCLGDGDFVAGPVAD